MSRAFRTAIVGFGRIAALWAADHRLKQSFRYATHAEALRDHPRFELIGVVDPLEERLREARDRWSVRNVAASSPDLQGREEIDVLVLATPPGDRALHLDAFPNLVAVMSEKPLGSDLVQARRLVDACAARGVLLAVNLLRRADTTVRALAEGGLKSAIGRPQTAFGLYAGGLNNNGTHLIDLARLFFGEAREARALSAAREEPGGDIDTAFALEMQGGMSVSVGVLDAKQYREHMLDIWGETGRLEYLHGGRVVRAFGLVAGSDDDRELDVESGRTYPPTIGDAIYHMYDNLAAAIDGTQPLVSSGDNALATAVVVEAVRRSLRAGGTAVPCAPHDMLV